MRARRVLAALGAVALATAGIVTTGSVTAAVAIAPANPAPVCTVIEAQPMVRCTVTYNYTGTEQVFTPPTGITRLQFELVGGRGGDAAALSTVGGQADKVRTADVSHAVQQFFVNVGGAGSSTEGGYNGGGAPGYIGGGASNRQGGGGGASDIRTVAGTEPGSLGSQIIVAGGGGGASAFLNGGNAGMPGCREHWIQVTRAVAAGQEHTSQVASSVVADTAGAPRARSALAERAAPTPPRGLLPVVAAAAASTVAAAG